MTVLLVKVSPQNIHLSIYKIYRKKAFPRIKAKIHLIPNNIQLSLYNSYDIETLREELSFNHNPTVNEIIEQAMRHEKLIHYEFRYIISKIDNGGGIYSELTSFHPRTYKELKQLDETALQQNQLELANYLYEFYSKAKHYLCFDSWQEAHSAQISTYLGQDSDQHHSLLVKSIIKNLSKCVYKTEARKSWLIININNKQVIFSLINKMDCMFNFSQQINLTDFNASSPNIINNYTASKISQAIAQILTINNGIFGLIFSGKVGYTNHSLRALILKSLAWANISFNIKANKANHYILHKDNSNSKILLVKGNENQEILDQFTNRL